MKKKLLIALGIIVAVIVLFYFGLFLTACFTEVQGLPASPDEGTGFADIRGG